MKRDKRLVEVGPDTALRCPSCRNDFLHIRSSKREETEIHIDFWCENCPNVSTVYMYTHEGQTFVEWVLPKSKGGI